MTNPRVIPGLTLYPVDMQRGDSIIYKARFQMLDEVLESIGRTSGLGWKLEWTGSGLNFQFTVEEGADLSSTVTISTGFGNVRGYTFLNSIADMRNTLYVAGADEEGEVWTRPVTLVYDTTEPEGWARREAFIDASDCVTSDEMTARGEEELATLGESVSLEVNYLEGDSFVIGQDFDLGDIVTVNYPDIVTVESRIISVTEEIAPGTVPKVTLGISREYPDLKSVVKGIRKSTSQAGRS